VTLQKILKNNETSEVLNMTHEELILKTKNKNMNKEILNELREIYQRLYKMGFKQIGGAYAVANDDEEFDFLLTLDEYFRGVEQKKSSINHS
jgi:hypothetical protein